MPQSLLLWAALSSCWPVGHTTIQYREDLLSKMWRHLLPKIEVPGQYPCKLRMRYNYWFFSILIPLIFDQSPRSYCLLVIIVSHVCIEFTMWEHALVMSLEHMRTYYGPQMTAFLWGGVHPQMVMLSNKEWKISYFYENQEDLRTLICPFFIRATGLGSLDSCPRKRKGIENISILCTSYL